VVDGAFNAGGHRDLNHLPTDLEVAGLVVGLHPFQTVAKDICIM